MLEVRPLRASDARAVHRLLADPNVASWFRPDDQPEPYGLRDCEELVDRQVGHWAAHRFGMSLGWEGKTCVGWSLVQHTIVAGSSEVEIGWTVSSARWGQGIGTHLGQHALDRAAQLGLRSTVAYARADNAASRRVMEKLGLGYEREFEHRGRPHVLYRKALAGIPAALP